MGVPLLGVASAPLDALDGEVSGDSAAHPDRRDKPARGAEVEDGDDDERVALGLIATATQVGTAFYAFGLILLPTLTFVGFVTFERAVQSGIEDLGYARRLALLRGYYFDEAPELTSYLMSVPGPEPLLVLGLSAGRWQAFRTVAAMVAVITAVLAGSAIGLLAAVASEHSLAAALVAGGVVALAALVAMMRFQQSAWERATSAPVSFDADDTERVQR
jgi:hypothetical protein